MATLAGARDGFIYGRQQSFPYRSTVSIFELGHLMDVNEMIEIYDRYEEGKAKAIHLPSNINWAMVKEHPSHWPGCLIDAVSFEQAYLESYYATAITSYRDGLQRLKFTY